MIKLILLSILFLLNLNYGLDKDNKVRQFNMFVAGFAFAGIIKLLFEL